MKAQEHSSATSRRDFVKLGTLAGAGVLLSELPSDQAWAQDKSQNLGAVDVHAHFYPERFLKVLAEEGGPAGWSAHWSPPKVELINTRTNAGVALDASYWDLDQRRKRMDEQGVTAHLLSLTVPMVHWAPLSLSIRLAEMVNDAMAEAHTAFPERFYGCAALPAQDVPATLKELERASKLPGIRAVYLPASIQDHDYLSDAVFAPVLEQCEAMGLPVLLHPLGMVSQRLQPYYFSNLLGNPFDTTVAAAHLVLSGTLDRFPKLQVVLPHAGGTFPYVVGRLQRGQEVRMEAKNRARLPFQEYLRRFHYDTITHSSQALQFLITSVGADRVMLGSDYCFDMGYDHPRAIIAQVALQDPRPAPVARDGVLKPADQELIYHGNARKLFRL
jgi:aminocarboxymuconate-semialdehyde decarboxylase